MPETGGKDDPHDVAARPIRGRSIDGLGVLSRSGGRHIVPAVRSALSEAGRLLAARRVLRLLPNAVATVALRHLWRPGGRARGASGPGAVAADAGRAAI